MSSSETRPARDPITATTSSAKASPKRSDLLNDKPRTRSLGSKGASFSKGDDKSSWPCPNNPYGDE